MAEEVIFIIKVWRKDYPLKVGGKNSIYLDLKILCLVLVNTDLKGQPHLNF